MTEVERTTAGLQTVIPGCERRTVPKSTTRVDEDGQGLLHFYKPASLREQLTVRADAPLLPKRGQKGSTQKWFIHLIGRPLPSAHRPTTTQRKI